MSVDRLERVDSLLKRVIGDAMFRIMQTDTVGAGLITVTGVQCARNLRNATVSISVLGHEKERGSILSAFRSKRNEFQKLINRDIRLKYTPVLQFVLDESVEKGDHVLDVLSKMELAGEIPPEEG